MATSRILSFKYAFSGIWQALKEEPNMMFHFLIALVVILLGFILNISSVEWVIIILTIGGVMVLELTNTAIETVVDSFTDKDHPGAKKAKDISAGAVLVGAIMAAIVGLIIFVPYFL